MDTIRSVLVPIHREGHKFVAIFAAVTFVLFWIAEPLGWAGVVLTLWCTYFFRDPARVTPVAENILVAPADGVVQMIERAVPPEELGMGLDPRQRISIFMNVFDVHVNRSPVDATVTATAYRPGSFLNAALDKASIDNERQALKLKLNNGKEIAVVQIAGLVARRILCDAREGRALKAGERFGMIRFGSRVDVYLDEGMVPLVIVGQKTIGGESVIAEDNAALQPRVGEVR